MPTYNHAYTLAFEVKSKHADASDVTPAMLTAAILQRIAALQATPLQEDILDACGTPFDTFEEPDE